MYNQRAIQEWFNESECLLLSLLLTSWVLWWIAQGSGKLNPSPQQFTFWVTQLKRVTDRKSACADRIVCLEDRNQEKNAVERKRTKQTYILNDLKIKQKCLTIHFPSKKKKKQKVDLLSSKRIQSAKYRLLIFCVSVLKSWNHLALRLIIPVNRTQW